MDAYKMTVPTGRKLVGCNRAANQALSAFMQASQAAASGQKQGQDNMVDITIECEESDIITDSGSEMYFAKLDVLLSLPTVREFTLEGPRRHTKPEAIKDSEVLGKVFQLEGEAGVKRVIERLERKMWSAQEMDGANESSLDAFLAMPGLGMKQEKLIPPGEGWTRASDEMLWCPRSQVHFVQSGRRMGQYLIKEKGAWQEVPVPHASVDFQISVRAGGASVVRRGAKLERTVLLNELPKIARLALKFPLSFVDSPASAYAIFQGLRSAEAADWCAKNFHTKLIPQLASKIHAWQTKDLQDVLKKVLQDLDAEVLKSPHAFSGCSAGIALQLGDRLIVAGVGQVRAVLLLPDKSTRQLLRCTADFQSAGAERERVEEAGGILHGGLVHRSQRFIDGLDDAQRILASRHVFEVLQLEEGAPADVKQVRTAYRKLALKVHPDKIPEDADVESFNKAFSKLESAKEALEAMVTEDAECCRELHKVLRYEVHTREGAADLFSLSKEATTDTDQVADEAEKAAKKEINRLSKMQAVGAADYQKAVAMCNEAVETLRRPSSAEALPRQEALLRLGLSTSRAIGARDLRAPSPITRMEPECMSWHVPCDKHCRLALLCGATANLKDEQLALSTARLLRQPKAAATRWCLDADASASSVGAVCITFQPRRGDWREDAGGPAAKRQKTASLGQQQAGCVFLRHILFRHQLLRAPDPMARREGTAKGPGEAESRALAALEKLVAEPNSFLKLCRELSDCQTATQPGQLVGHLGWLGRGEQELSLEEAAFALDEKEFSDIVTTSRGVHILQRLG